MADISVKEKILKHLEGINELESQSDTETVIQDISERYDIAVPVVKKAFAEWQAGQIHNTPPKTNEKQ